MTWRVVSRRSIRNIQFGLLFISTIWGLDYLLPPTESGKVLNFVETHSYWPLNVWGGIMVLAGVVGIICEILLGRSENRYWRFWLGSWLSHVLFASIFIALAYGAFISAPLATEGWAGFRTPFAWAFFAVMHTAYARRLDKPVDVSNVEFPPKADNVRGS
ncbi:hypothetical protein PBI_DAMIEN_36 [Mycobacterium phage Damien]|uniref:minor tail protein n=1 Tax=Mycobacterium phage Damien TaxID=1486469 RepID=UPI00045F70BD|nr:minor tail protein [Mycobacterium phage Damien]AHZ95397.1 hypothetical protein PBI_DAMIEN_36 [Mycobacterium phage Damien]QLF83921.1 holin [Mycobacterium phage Beckerton]